MRKLFVTLPCLVALGGATGTTAQADYAGTVNIRYANAYCESGGDPHNTHNSKYRGKWQFDQSTWNRFAPRFLRGKDPAYVSEYWQDYVAQRVTYDAWPNC